MVKKLLEISPERLVRVLDFARFWGKLCLLASSMQVGFLYGNKEVGHETPGENPTDGRCGN